MVHLTLGGYGSHDPWNNPSSGDHQHVTAGCFHGDVMGDVMETEYGMGYGFSEMTFRVDAPPYQEAVTHIASGPPEVGECYRVWADFLGNTGDKNAIPMFEPIKIEPLVC